MENKIYPKIADKDQFRKANHVYYTQVAELLNDAGIDQRMLLEGLREYGRVPNTKDSIKDAYRNIGQQMYGIKSTQDLTTVQASEVEKVFTAAIQISQKVTLPSFPSRETQYQDQQGWRKAPLSEKQ